MRKICLSLPWATSDFPFDEATEAFRVHGRIFALHFGGQARPIEVNLKCDPDLAADLRAAYPDIAPGWHMNHQHWNTVKIDGELAEHARTDDDLRTLRDSPGFQRLVGQQPPAKP